MTALKGSWSSLPTASEAPLRIAAQSVTGDATLAVNGGHAAQSASRSGAQAGSSTSVSIWRGFAKDP